MDFLKKFKDLKKINTSIIFLCLFFIISVSAAAEPMREGDSLPPGYRLGGQLPQSPSPPVPPAPAVPVPTMPPSIVPADPPQREPLSLPLASPPEAIARTPQPSTIDGQIAFSRVVRATVGQRVEIPFGGNGWVYLGELIGQNGVSYSSHRLDAEGQVFSFIAEKIGVYALKFYKQDFLRDYTLTDYVQITVTRAPDVSVGGGSSANRAVYAEPRWPSPEQEAAAIDGGAAGVSSGQASSSSAGTTAASAVSATAAQSASPDTAASAPAAVQSSVSASSSDAGDTAVSEAVSGGLTPPLATSAAGIPPEAGSGASIGSTSIVLSDGAPPAQYYQQAQAQFDAKNYAGVVSVLDQFRANYPGGAEGDDRALWLYGQACEAAGPTRDVKIALACYQRIVSDYPFSDYHAAAQNRVTYIDRYYLAIQ